MKDIGRRFPLELACARVNRVVMLINLYTESVYIQSVHPYVGCLHLFAL